MKTISVAVLAASLLALGACSDERDGESAEDFASRVGTGTPASTAVSGAVETAVIEAAPPAGADVLSLEQLGNIAGVDLGPRDGGCTFSSNGVELLIAGARDDPGSAGRAVVRIGGKLYALASAGGLNAIRKGTRFSGEGVTADLAAAGQASRLTVTNGAGQSKAVVGSWVCA